MLALSSSLFIVLPVFFLAPSCIHPHTSLLHTPPYEPLAFVPLCAIVCVSSVLVNCVCCSVCAVRQVFSGGVFENLKNQTVVFEIFSSFVCGVLIAHLRSPSHHEACAGVIWRREEFIPLKCCLGVRSACR